MQILCFRNITFRSVLALSHREDRRGQNRLCRGRILLALREIHLSFAHLLSLRLQPPGQLQRPPLRAVHRRAFSSDEFFETSGRASAFLAKR